MMLHKLIIFGPSGSMMYGKQNCSHTVNLNYVKDLYDMNDHTFIVWGANNNSNTWRVYYFDDKPQECECGNSYLQRYV